MKTLLGILALGALSSVLYGVHLVLPSNSLRSPSDPTLLKADVLSQLQGTGDTDHDGIQDKEETYWKTDFKNSDTDGDGFLDGEEVLSGHDPAKKGPNDWLDKSKNLTNRAVTLAAGGIVVGDLMPGNPKYDASVQKLADDLAQKYQENTDIAVDKITLTPTDTAQDHATYIEKMVWNLRSVFVPALDDADKFLTPLADLTWDDAAPLTDNPKRYATFVLFARTLAQTTGARAAKLAAQPTPMAFSSLHANAIRLLRTLQRRYELIATMKEDPLQGMAALQDIIQLHTTSLPAFLIEFSTVANRTQSTNGI